MSACSGKKKVDHTYRDLSRYLQKGGEVVQHKKSGSNFPAKLHRMLSEPEYSRIIFWMPHGRAFKIRNKVLLTSRAVPEYFGQTKFESFTRQLNGWGFKRLYRSGPDLGCYYHEFFLRGLPRLTGLMRRAPSNQGKLAPFPEGEPDFYRISDLYPVPPVNSECSPSYAAANLDSASTAIPSSYAHDSLMPVVHSYPHQNSGSATNMLGTSMSDLHQYPAITSWRKDNQASSLKASPAVEATELALKSDSSSKPISTRQEDAASNMMFASQPASTVQAQDWSNHAQSTMLQNVAIPQDSTLSLAAAALAAATNESWPSMLMSTIRPSSNMGAQNEMMPTAQANLSEISRAYTTNQVLSASMPCLSTHAKNTDFQASASEVERDGPASATRKRSSSDSDQAILGQAEYSMSSDVGAVMKALASYQVPNTSNSRNEPAQESPAASIFPVEPAAASTFLNNQAPSQRSRWSLPPTLSNINSAYFPRTQLTQNTLSMAAIFPGAPAAASNSINNQFSFQHQNEYQLPSIGQSNFAFSSGSEYTSTETTTPSDSNHQFQNTQVHLESSHQDQEDTKTSSQEQDDDSSLPGESVGGDDGASFSDDMNALLDTL